jgi:hypothetical protein
MKTRTYTAPGVKADDLAEKLRQWFADNGYETQVFRTTERRLIVQGFRDDLWRVAVGLAAALTVQIRPVYPDQIHVDVGAGAWGDKLFVAGIGLLFFVPLVLPAAWGTYQQFQLDQQVWDAVEAAVADLTRIAETAPPPPVEEEPVAAVSEPEPEPSDVPPPLPQGWFNDQTNEIYLIQFFQRMESWQRAISDGTIDSGEIHAQAERVTDLLKRIEPGLSDEAHSKLTEVFNELAVLQGMQSYALFQHFEAGRTRASTPASTPQD